MNKKLTLEYLYKYYKERGCELLETEYINYSKSMNYKCKCGNITKTSFQNFKKNVGCRKCSNRKNTQEYVYNYYKEHNYEMISVYTGNKNKDKLICPVGHEIEITFNSFNKGNRCGICSKTKKLKQEFVYNYYKEYGYTLKSIYNGNKNKDKLECPAGHVTYMKFNSFQQGFRCYYCGIDSITGPKHPSWNHNREEKILNQRLRKKRNKSWPIRNMKDDPLYKEYLLEPKKYVMDHIIPISLFCKLYIQYNLNEEEIRNIINDRKNLQLLTKCDNHLKFNKGYTLLDAYNYLIDNNVIMEPFETLSEEKGNNEK